MVVSCSAKIKWAIVPRTCSTHLYSLHAYDIQFVLMFILGSGALMVVSFPSKKMTIRTQADM